MATAALINPEIKIIPLADADLAGLENLFDEECAEWLELLRWDYKGASMSVSYTHLTLPTIYSV